VRQRTYESTESCLRGMEPINPDRSQVEKNWDRRGFSCGLWTDPPGQVWEGYTHSVDELLMVAVQIETVVSG